jgi:hypothetical protein
MTNEFQTHLSEEALNDLLIGMGSAEAEQHLAGCAQCRARVELFHSDLKLLDETSMAWSRVRAASMADGAAATTSRRLSLATMGWAATGVALLALAVPVWRNVNRHADQTPTASTPPAAVAAEDSEAQIAADNQLLREIDAVVNSHEASPFGEPLRTDRPRARHKVQPE